MKTDYRVSSPHPSPPWTRRRLQHSLRWQVATRPHGASLDLYRRTDEGSPRVPRARAPELRGKSGRSVGTARTSLSLGFIEVETHSKTRLYSATLPPFYD